ncbi:hypothetical protein ACOWPH_14605 [Anabaena sp. PCC 7938]|nr:MULTISPECIES: hypothetical protein [Anabaena]MCM2410046.1 hypothetical protein [Anabaena sp. CCAP 1446/1C]
MKAYSLNVRQKIFDTYLERGISQRQLAERFCVSLSAIADLVGWVEVTKPNTIYYSFTRLF